MIKFTKAVLSELSCAHEDGLFIAPRSHYVKPTILTRKVDPSDAAFDVNETPNQSAREVPNRRRGTSRLNKKA